MNKNVIVALSLLLLAGCAGWQPTGERKAEADYPLWRERVVLIEAIDGWQLNGRLSVSGKDADNAQGKLAWQQQGREFKMNVRGPFGIGATRISGDGKSVTVKNKKGEFYAPNAEVAIKQQIGWEVPVEALRYWVLGRPAPTGVAAMKINGAGQLVGLSQSGWQVEYSEYAARTGDRVELPKRLVATRPGVQVRLAIDSWRLP